MQETIGKNGMNRAGTVLDFNYKRTNHVQVWTKVFIEYDGSMTRVVICCT